MKMEKQLPEFIQARIEGKSFAEIAKELNVAKSTLIEWNKVKATRDTINDGKAFAINELVRAFEYDRRARLKTMLQLSKKINDELLNRNFDDISTDKLLQMSIANDGRLLKIVEGYREIGEDADTVIFGNGDGFFNFSYDE